MPASLRLSCLVALAIPLIAGCGSADVRGDGEPAPIRSKHSQAPSATVIATLGDSIVAGSPHWDPDPDVRQRLADVDEDSQWQRWVDVDAELRNCGVWGERTDQIADRYAACAKGADAIILQGGINDIVQGRPVTEAACDLQQLVDRALQDKLDVALIEVLPWNNGDTRAAEQIRMLNSRIRDVAAARAVPVLPFYATLDDPEHTGRMPGALTVEGDHPNTAGYRLLGERAWRLPAAGHAPSADAPDQCS